MKMLKLTLIDEPRNYARMLNDGLVSCVIQNRVLDSVWNLVWTPVQVSVDVLVCTVVLMSVKESIKEFTNENDRH